MTYRMRSAQAGFTLIEVLIAIALVAILGAVAIPAYMSHVEKGKRTATEASLNTFKVAINSFHEEVGRYPDSLNDLVRRPLNADMAKRWKQPFLDVKNGELPLDGWKREFEYRPGKPGAHPPYELYSWGPAGEGSPKDEWISAW